MILSTAQNEILKGILKKKDPSLEKPPATTVVVDMELGYGKTLPVTLAAREFLRQGKNVIFLAPNQGVCSNFKDSLFENGVSENSVLEYGMQTNGQVEKNPVRREESLEGCLREGSNKVIIFKVKSFCCLPPECRLFSMNNVGMVAVDEAHEAGLRGNQTHRRLQVILENNRGCKLVLVTASFRYKVSYFAHLKPYEVVPDPESVEPPSDVPKAVFNLVAVGGDVEEALRLREVGVYRKLQQTYPKQFKKLYSAWKVFPRVGQLLLNKGALVLSVSRQGKRVIKKATDFLYKINTRSKFNDPLLMESTEAREVLKICTKNFEERRQTLIFVKHPETASLLADLLHHNVNRSHVVVLSSLTPNVEFNRMYRGIQKECKDDGVSWDSRTHFLIATVYQNRSSANYQVFGSVVVLNTGSNVTDSQQMTGRTIRRGSPHQVVHLFHVSKTKETSSTKSLGESSTPAMINESSTTAHESMWDFYYHLSLINTSFKDSSCLSEEEAVEVAYAALVTKTFDNEDDYDEDLQEAPVLPDVPSATLKVEGHAEATATRKTASRGSASEEVPAREEVQQDRATEAAIPAHEEVQAKKGGSARKEGGPAKKEGGSAKKRGVPDSGEETDEDLEDLDVDSLDDLLPLAAKRNTRVPVKKCRTK